jgi:glycosyltransferase involved in cell wall biosynthesis
VNLEAMAAGVCVVTANVGSSSAIITDGKDGYLIRAEPNSFADAIYKLANDRITRKRIGRNATATARTYQWSEVLDDVVRTYRDLSSN